MKFRHRLRSLVFLRKPDMIVALAATVTSICALIVAVQQTQIMQEQQRASAWPHLEWLPSNVPDFRITVSNKGLGPAIVEDVRIRYNGKDYGADIERLFRQVPGADTLNFITSTVKGRVVAPGESIDMLLIRDPDKGRFFTILNGQPSIEICYRSVYGEYWVSQGVQVRKVERCGGVRSEGQKTR